jgi:hypothetical protein
MFLSLTFMIYSDPIAILPNFMGSPQITLTADADRQLTNAG